MSLFDEMLRALLERNDPAQREEEEARFEQLQHEIMMRARETEQLEPEPKERRRFAPHYALNPRNWWPNLSFEPQMQVAYAVLVLILGLWAGQSLMPVQSKNIYVQSLVANEKISVMAMAEPWEGWIEGGE